MKRYTVAGSAGVLALLAAVSSGCGGVSGSHSVSPASFFLPGLIHHEAPRHQQGPERTPETPDALPGDDQAPPTGDAAKALPS